MPFVDAQVLNEVLEDAFEKTNLKPPTRYVGSHILRHSLATNMVRQGASLAEIGDVLRHRARRSTMIYAKLDVDGLRSIAPRMAGGRRCKMSTLVQELDRYLTIRRSLGFDLGTTARVLRRFVAFAQGRKAKYVTTDLFLAWQAEFGEANQQTWSARLGMVRQFALWLSGIDPRNEVPPKGLIPGRYRRARPYIYSEQEIVRIIEEATRLPSPNGIRALTFATLFGLIAVTGLRVSEAIALDDSDVDLETGVLTDSPWQIRQGADRADIENHGRAAHRLCGGAGPASGLHPEAVLRLGHWQSP